MAAIVFSRGSGMQSHGGATLFLGDVSRFQEGLVLVVDAHPDLCGDGDSGRRADSNHSMNQFGEEVGLPGKGGSPTMSGDLGDWAAEVHVDMIDPARINHHSGGLLHDLRVHPVQLQGAHLLLGGEATEPEGLGVARHQGPGRHHLPHIQSVGSVLPAKQAEGPVGHARHRRKHDRHRHGYGAQLYRSNLRGPAISLSTGHRPRPP